VKRLAELPWRRFEPFIVLVLLVGFSYLKWDPSLGIMVKGALLGSLSALTAVGIALIYRANRVINFAQGDLGVVPAQITILIMAADQKGDIPDVFTGLPYAIAVAIGLGIAILLGFIVERTIINRFKKAPRLILTVATIGVGQLLTALAIYMLPWFGFKNMAGLPSLEPPFEYSREIGGLIFDESDFIVFLVVPALLIGLALFLRYSPYGIAIRASAERSDRAATLGVPVPRVQTVVWVIATVFAFVAVFLSAGVGGFTFGAALGVPTLVVALAAAVIGRMERFGTITAAAIGLGVLGQSVYLSTGVESQKYMWIFFVVVIALLTQRRSRGSRIEDQAVTSWQFAKEMRPIPTEMRKLTEVRVAVWVVLGLCAVAVLGLPAVLSNHDLSIAVNTGVIAIIGVSLVVLTGWAGHVSLGQMAFAAIGGAVGAWVTQSQGLDLGIAILVGGIAGAVTSVIIGIPAARAGGLTLAVITLTFSAAVIFWVLNPTYFSWVPTDRLEHPTLFGSIEINTESRYYWVMLGILAISIAMAYGLRRSRTGRVLIGLRDNPRATEAYGINTIRTTLVAFAFSGFLAAMAGVIYVQHARTLSDNALNNPFDAASSLRVFTVVVIGGLASIPGVILGALYVFTIQYYMPLPQLRFLATGFGLLIVLLITPAGLGAAVTEGRDAALRWLARKKNLLVPSLLADRRVDELDASPEMAAVVADALERPEIEESVELGT